MNDPGLVERPFLYPGVCLDGSQPAPGEGVFDTQIELFDGYHVYVGRRMGRLIGDSFGMVDSAELHAADAANKKHEARIAALEGELAELRPIADSIARFATREGVEV